MEASSVVVTKKGHNKETDSALELNTHLKDSQIEMRVKHLVNSLGDVLGDITALEVNTMIVQEITGSRFIPLQVYREIYPISKAYLEQQKIHRSLSDRYLELRRSLEIEYSLLVTNPKSEFYDGIMAEQIEEYFPILTNPQTSLETIETRLPDPNSPDGINRVQKLLKNSSFLRVLRKLSETKTSLDNQNKFLHSQSNSQKTDIVYAQTVVQLDGNILNRYAQDLLDHPQRDAILKIHHYSVEAGEKQWQGLLGFVIELVQKAFTQRIF
jgi:hypothetical protein